MAKFIITEEQYNILKEWDLNKGTNQLKPTPNFTVTAPTREKAFSAMNSNSEMTQKMGEGPINVNMAIGNTAKDKQEQDNNMDKDTSKVTLDCTVNENSRIITKKELVENRFKHLRQNSKLYTVKDFLTK